MFMVMKLQLFIERMRWLHKDFPASAVNLLPNMNVSRTGYNEVDLTDNKHPILKIDFSLH